MWNRGQAVRDARRWRGVVRESGAFFSLFRDVVRSAKARFLLTVTCHHTDKIPLPRSLFFFTPTAPKPRGSRRTECLLPPRQASTLVSGLRSEHSNPPRSTLAGSGLNRPRAAPEIQSRPPLQPGDTPRRRGRGTFDFGIRRGDRARAHLFCAAPARLRLACRRGGEQRRRVL